MINCRNIQNEISKNEILNSQAEEMIGYFKDMIEKFDIFDDDRSA